MKKGTGKQKGSKQPNQTTSKGTSLRTRMVGAATFAGVSGVGMTNVLRHKWSWLAGYVYVGNGTKGATDGVYVVRPVDQADTIIGDVPIAGGDAAMGASYISDILKHYARVRVVKQKMIVQTVNPSTSNSMVVVVGPKRGAGDLAASTQKTDATAGSTYTNVLGMAGAFQAASWETVEKDLTDFIAGGFGAKQNEFNTANPAGLNESIVGVEGNGVVGTVFQVSGVNNTAGLRGTVTHAIIIEQEVDLIDFVAGAVAAGPEELARRGIVRKGVRNGDTTSDSLASAGSETGGCELDGIRQQLMKLQAELARVASK